LRPLNWIGQKGFMAKYNQTSKSANERIQRLADEVGTITKNWGGRISVALVFPNTYYVGMSSLGYQAVYDLFNAESDIVCERVFLPDSAEQQPDLPLPMPRSLESNRPLSDFDVVAVSVSFELDYFNIVRILQAAGIPLMSKDRDGRQPLLVVGGACAIDNAEPIAPIFDIVVVGEAEALWPPLHEAIHDHIYGDRDGLLKAAAMSPGLYVPAFYDTWYSEDGRFGGIKPSASHPRPDIALPVSRQGARNLNQFSTHSRVLTRNTEFGDAYLMEVARGCARGCRFCLAGFAFLPQRDRHVPFLLEQAKEGLKFRDKIGLVGASVSDYRYIDELVTGLRAMGARISISSMRADSMTPTLVQALVDSGARTLTFAPEAASERLRRVINKRLSYDEVMASTDLLGKAGVRSLKMYFMIGLPTEEQQDVEEIVSLSLAVKKRMDGLHPGSEIQVSVTPFVPKSHTPFQWGGMYPLDDLEDKVKYLKKELRQKGVTFKIESPKWVRVQGTLARGDRRLAAVLAYTNGTVNQITWERALEKFGIDPLWYLDAYAEGAPLPWGHIESGVSFSSLARQWNKAQVEARDFVTISEFAPRSEIRARSVAREQVATPSLPVAVIEDEGLLGAKVTVGHDI